MKKLLFLASFLIGINVFAQAPEAPVKFEATKHSFGQVPQSIPVTTSFSFTNTSDKPVIIETATAECGCTTPEYPKTPILKGQTGSIKVTYNAASPGKFTKNVHVKVANVQQPFMLTIDGEVVPKKSK